MQNPETGTIGTINVTVESRGRSKNQRSYRCANFGCQSREAVLRIGARTLKPLALADSNLATAGEHVVAIGNPLCLGGTISDGLLSAIRELPRLRVVQISAGRIGVCCDRWRGPPRHHF